MKTPVLVMPGNESLRREIMQMGRECEAALCRSVMFEEMGHLRTAAISRERAVTTAHNAEILARGLARFETRPSTLLLNPGEPT